MNITCTLPPGIGFVCSVLCMCVFFALNRSFHLPVDIQHNQCPCQLFNPISRAGRPGGSSDEPPILLVFESQVQAPGGSDI